MIRILKANDRVNHLIEEAILMGRQGVYDLTEVERDDLVEACVKALPVATLEDIIANDHSDMNLSGILAELLKAKDSVSEQDALFQLKPELYKHFASYFQEHIGEMIGKEAANYKAEMDFEYKGFDREVFGMRLELIQGGLA